MNSTKDEKKELGVINYSDKILDPLFVYQAKVINILKHMGYSDNFSTVVELPTGAGKTYTAVSYILDEAFSNNCKVLWLAHREFLLEQAYNSLKNAFSKESSPNRESLKYAIVSGKSTHANLEDIKTDTDIIFGSIFSMSLDESSNNTEDEESGVSNLKKWLESSQQGNKKLYVILDEAHHIGATTYNDLFEKLFLYINNYAFVGLTATPCRDDYEELKFFKWFKNGYVEQYIRRGADRVHIDDKEDTKLYLAPDTDKFTKLRTKIGEESSVEVSGKRVKHNDIKGNKIKIVELKDLIAEGVLIEPEFIRVEDFMSSVNTDAGIAKSVVKNLKETPNLGKTIIFAPNRSIVESIMKEIASTDLGYRCEEYTAVSKTIGEGKEAKNKLDLFITGEIDILLTIDVLSEGLDVSTLNTIILIDSTHSNIQLRQRIGRVVRKAKDFDKQARVIWYYYAKDDDTSKKVGKYETNNLGYDLSAIQDKKSLDADITRDTYYLTAPEYVETLDYKDSYSIDNSIVYRYLLEILNLFKSNNDIQDFVGYYDLELDQNTKRTIFFDDLLLKGFKQLYTRVHCDWLNLKDRNIKISDFNSYWIEIGYANEEDCLTDIMKVCFFLCRPKATSTFYVDREDIEFFINYLLQRNFEEPKLQEIQAVAIKYVNKVLSSECGEEYSVLNGVSALCDALLARDDLHEKLKVCKESTYDGIEAKAVLEKCIAAYVDDRNKSLKITEQELKEKYRAYEDDCKEAGEALSDKDRDLKRVSDILETVIEAEKAKRIVLYTHDKDSRPRINKKKDHTRQLRTENHIDYEIDDLGRALASGYNWSSEKAEGTLSNGSVVRVVDMSFDLINRTLVNKSINTILTRTRSIRNNTYSALSMAQSILINTHHIVTSQDDIKELTDALSLLMGYLGVLNVSIPDAKKDLTNDVICKLGSKGSGDYLKELLEAFKCINCSPRYLAYLVYDKVYEKVFPEVSFIRSGKVPSDNIQSAFCQNCKDLFYICNCELTDLGLPIDYFKQFNLNPVGDAISDYRPYVKVLQTYQGIKPDLLCRMMNIIVNQVPGEDLHFISGCGGSGADIINRFSCPNKFKTETYNEYGYLLTNFYNVLKDENKYKKLNRRVKKFIKEIVNYNVNNEQEIGEGFTDFIYNAFEEPDITKLFVDKDDKVIKSSALGAQSRTKSSSAEISGILKLLYNKNYAFIYNYYFGKNNGVIEDAEAEIIKNIQLKENALHGIWRRCQEVFLWGRNQGDAAFTGKPISDVDLALIVFIYFSFTDRYLFDNCFIEDFINFASSYEQYLEMGHERVANWDIYQKEPRDVNIVLSNVYNDKSCVAYCDIPYAETSSASYVYEKFKFDEFVNVLDNFKGKYIVSSRYNICTPLEVKQAYYEEKDFSDAEYEEILKKQKLTEKEKAADDTEGLSKEKFNKKVSAIVKFYSSFAEMKKNKAKTIVIPYTCHLDEREFNIHGKPTQRKFESNYRLTLQDVERMFKETIYSNIPVEVMITDIEFDNEKTEEYRLCNAYRLSDDISAIPTVCADSSSSSYLVEPIYLVIKYDRYLDLMKRAIFQDEINKADTENAVNYMQKYFKK